MAYFPCQTCNQAFESRQSLNEHLEYTHCIGKTDEKMAKKSGNLIFIFLSTLIFVSKPNLFLSFEQAFAINTNMYNVQLL